jgi:hypothetical protein
MIDTCPLITHPLSGFCAETPPLDEIVIETPVGPVHVPATFCNEEASLYKASYV